MLRNWTELLPLVFHRWYAKRHCERFVVGGLVVTNPRPGVMIQTEESKGGECASLRLFSAY